MATKKKPAAPRTDPSRRKAREVWDGIVKPITDWIDSDPARALEIMDLFKGFERSIQRARAPVGPPVGAEVGGSMTDYLTPADGGVDKGRIRALKAKLQRQLSPQAKGSTSKRSTSKV